MSQQLLVGLAAVVDRGIGVQWLAWRLRSQRRVNQEAES